MPGWKLHNDWAVKIGIERKVANRVNYLEDLPHIPDTDWFRGYIPDHHPTVEEMQKEDLNYLKAWILHLIIDEVETQLWEDCTLDEIQKSILNYDFWRRHNSYEPIDPSLMQKCPNEIATILKFIKENINEIITDVKARSTILNT